MPFIKEMQKNLTKGSIIKNIAIFSLPYFMSYFLQTLYGLADLYITGQFNGTATINAVTIGSQVMHMVTVIIVGIAMGTTVMISQAVGAGNLKDANRAAGNSITIFAVFAVFLTALLLCLVNPIVKVMSTPVEAVAETRKYLMICFAGIPFITAYNVISSIFRGMGDSKSPMIFIGISCVINIGLDYLFIGIMGLGATGAALGTVCAQSISVIIAFIVIRNKRLLTISKADLHPEGRMIGKILKTGAPVAVQDGCIQISFLIITVIANSRGLQIATAVGIVEKIISVLFLVPSTMLSTVSALAAQNYGAGNHARARKTLWYGAAICVIFGAVFTVICRFFGKDIVGMFSDEEAVIRYGCQYLRTYAFDCIFAGMHFCFSGYFCAYNYSIVSFIHNLISIIVMRIPGAYFASKWYPDNLEPMGMAAPIGSIISTLICIGMYIWMRRSRIKDSYGREINSL